MNNTRIFKTPFANIYPFYIQKAEEIEDELMQKIRYLDKLVDELAKGRTMDKILRK